MRDFLVSYKCLLFTLLVFVVACEDDDGLEVVDESAPSEVPSGRIVPQGERAFVLTGFAEGSNVDDTDSIGKIWKIRLSELISNDCPQLNRELSVDHHISFAPSGILYHMNANDSILDDTKTWKWDDSMKGIYLNDRIRFIFTELNEEQATYYSDQSHSACDIITVEGIHEPMMD